MCVIFKTYSIIPTSIFIRFFLSSMVLKSLPASAVRCEVSSHVRMPSAIMCFCNGKCCQCLRSVSNSNSNHIRLGNLEDVAFVCRKPLPWEENPGLLLPSYIVGMSSAFCVELVSSAFCVERESSVDCCAAGS
ncbi:Uncharacterized protein TCM_035210 [Theobroma cacao]|uniref:Uncharacterized protein n=1 Tax=Theobroma cacao TaxID=3641 RepID=A0A061FIB0_THECC|nr:Uncharacterized protein TCM_035210 [Theobroma cacao]